MCHSISYSHILPLYLQYNLVRLPADQEILSLIQVLGNHKRHYAAAGALCKYSALVFIQRHVKKWIAERALARNLSALPFQSDILIIIQEFMLKSNLISHPILALALKNDSILVIARIRAHTRLSFSYVTSQTTVRTSDAFVVSREFAAHFPSCSFFACSRFPS